MTVAETLRRSTEYLERKDVPSPRVDAEHLLAHALGISRLELYTQHDRPLTREELEVARRLLERRGRREPLAYVLGEWGFRRLMLKVDARVLIPRPETEIVVERCLALLLGEDRPRVLDLGTGTGAIALAIEDEHPGARVTAVDASLEALALARENANRLGSRIVVREGGLETAAEGCDLVVSNPPYVAAPDWGALEPEIRKWEPRSALVGTGLHEEIARLARTRYLVFEVGDGEAARVAGALRSLGYGDVRITPDLAGRERVVEGTR